MTLYDFLSTFFVPVLIVAVGLVFTFMGYLFAFARTALYVPTRLVLTWACPQALHGRSRSPTCRSR